MKTTTRPAHVMTGPDHAVPTQDVRTAFVQRCGCRSGSSGECAACRRRRLQLQRQAAAAPTSTFGPTGDSPQAPAIVNRVLQSPGRPLEEAPRQVMEHRFGTDFRHVRIHSDASAAASARAVEAHAYTVGHHVVFGAGRYAPQTPGGQRLLAHELAHTIQQRGAAIPATLSIGPNDGPLEREARRAAEGGHRAPAAPVGASSQLLQREPAAETPLREDRGRIEAPEHGEDARIHVFRRLHECQCRNVPDVRDGVFWNPDAEAFAIAYRHCRGRTTTDVYAEVETNLSAFLSGGEPPQATGRLGFEINVVGREVSGRVQLEIRGGNAAGDAGIGGRVQVVFQGGEWRVFMTADYLRSLGASAGDRINLDLGGRIGPVTVEAQVRNVLTDAPSGSGAACVDLPGTTTRGCITLDIDDRGNVTPGVGIRGEFGGPRAREEQCYQCLCPPPRKEFECLLDIPPVPEQREREVTVNVPGDYRYYFRLNRATPAEDSALRARSTANLDEVAGEVSAGASITSIAAYASPEAPEMHNQGLSESRGAALLNLLRSRLPSGTPLPSPIAGGELLGRRPSPSPGSRLGDIITEHGFRSAEDLSVLLLGEEVPRTELAEQFASLFRALPEPADRLAVFGLGPSDPLAPQVLAAIEEFVQRPHAGTRPWERVFRLLRVGVVRTSRPEQRTVTESGYTRGSVERLSPERCETIGERAERQGVLPPIPDELRRPRRGHADRDIECTIEVRAEDRRRGCSYTIPTSMRLAPTAPSRAPRAFPSLQP
jgi:hypothetical protein